MDVESRREEEGLRCEREGLLRGEGWVGDTPPTLTRPNLRHIHFNMNLDERGVGWVGETLANS